MKNEVARVSTASGGKSALGNGKGSLFLVMPSKCSDVHKSAKKLMAIGRIREVMVTEGSYGFVVRADAGVECRKMGREIARVVGGMSRIAVCHYSYRK